MDSEIALILPGTPNPHFLELVEPAGAFELSALYLSDELCEGILRKMNCAVEFDFVHDGFDGLGLGTGSARLHFGDFVGERRVGQAVFESLGKLR